MTDSDLMNMLLDKKSENIPEDDVGRVFSALGIDDPLKRMKEKLIFKLEFELRRRREEKY